MIHYLKYIHNDKGYFLMQCFLFIQFHRQIITLSHRLQRILTSNHIGRYHIRRRKRNHVTNMVRPIIQTKGFLLLVTKIISTQHLDLDIWIQTLAPMLHNIADRTLKYPLGR